MANPAHLWALRGAMAPYAKWMLQQKLSSEQRPDLPSMPNELATHAAWACDALQSSALDVSGTMRKHQLKLADRQCRMAELSGRIQSMIVILATCLYAARQNDEIIRAAAATLAQDMRNKLTGRRPSDRDFKQLSQLGAALADNSTSLLKDVPDVEIMMRYDG
jgi:hypothetical protein